MKSDLKGIFKMETIDTVGELIKRLEKLPKEHKLNVNVDDAYDSVVYNVYIDEYARQRGRNEVTIRV
jgi:hypothetical protein